MCHEHLFQRSLPALYFISIWQERKKVMDAARKELPYTFPGTYNLMIKFLLMQWKVSALWYYEEEKFLMIHVHLFYFCKFYVIFSTCKLWWLAELVTRAQWEGPADHYNTTQEVSPCQSGRGKQTETGGKGKLLCLVWYNKSWAKCIWQI